MVGDLERNAMSRHQMNQNKRDRARDPRDTVHKNSPLHLLDMANESNRLLSKFQKIRRGIVWEDVRAPETGQDRTGKDERTKEGDLVGDEEMGERVLQLRSGVENVSNPERVQDGAIRCLSLGSNHDVVRD